MSKPISYSTDNVEIPNKATTDDVHQDVLKIIITPMRKTLSVMKSQSSSMQKVDLN